MIGKIYETKPSVNAVSVEKTAENGAKNLSTSPVARYCFSPQKGLK
jgi:hypothetical protein